MEQKRKKRLKQQGVFIVLIVMIVLAVVFALNKQNAEAIEYVEMVEIEVQNAVTEARKSVGTGVVYQSDEEGVWIATAAHVLYNKSDEDRIVLNWENASIECTIWMEAENTDLAYLYLPQKDIAAKMVMVPVETDKESYDMLTTGDIVKASGYFAGKQTDCLGVLTESWIYVEDFAQHMIVAECEVQHGMSGGGLYDEAGHFVGMVCGGNEEGELVAVPWHVMQARFEEMCVEE